MIDQILTDQTVQSIALIAASIAGVVVDAVLGSIKNSKIKYKGVVLRVLSAIGSSLAQKLKDR
jgi:hypothetical protein